MARNFTTIITDASFAHRILKASWAGACISDYGREFYGDVLKAACETSNDAELFAVVNTIHAGLRRAMALRPGVGWLIQTDNSHVVQLLNFHHQDPNNRSKPQRPPRSTPAQLSALDHLNKLKHAANPKFILIKHVKGHMAANERFPRHWVQEQLDTMAGRINRGG